MPSYTWHYNKLYTSTLISLSHLFLQKNAIISFNFSVNSTLRVRCLKNKPIFEVAPRGAWPPSNLQNKMSWLHRKDSFTPVKLAFPATPNEKLLWLATERRWKRWNSSHFDSPEALLSTFNRSFYQVSLWLVSSK